MIASKACSGPIPLRWAYGALRGIGPTLAEEARGRMELSRFARGALVIASKARSGPIPLRLAYLCGRSQEGSGEEGVFALCARGFGDRFQGSLRTDPAPLGVCGRSAGGRSLTITQKGVFSAFRAACSGPWA